MKKPEIILHSIVRSMIMLIPVVGSSIDQLSFGTISSLEDQKIIEQLKLLETEIRKLYSEKLTPEEIYESLKQTDGFQDTLKRIEEKELSLKNQLEIIKSESNEIKNKIKELKELNKKTLTILDSKLDNVDDELDFLFKDFEKISKTLFDLKKETENSSNIKSKSISEFKIYYEEIKEYCKELGNSIKLALEKKPLLLDPKYLFDLALFPYESKDIELIYLLYLIEKGAFELQIVNSDMLEINATLKLSNLRNNKNLINEYALNRFRKFVSLANIIEYKPNEEIVSQSLSSFMKKKDESGYFKSFNKKDMSGHSRSLMIDIIRLFALNSSQFQFVSTILSSDSRTKYLYNNLIEGNYISPLYENYKIISPKILAFMAFESRNSNNHELLVILHKIYLKVNKSINTEIIEFDNLREINDFLKELKKIEKEITLFKKEVRAIVFDKIKNAREQHILFMSAFEAFHKAYSQIGNDLVSFLTSEISFED